MKSLKFTALFLIAAIAIFPVSASGMQAWTGNREYMDQGDNRGMGPGGGGDYGSERMGGKMSFHYGEKDPGILLGSGDGTTGLNMKVPSLEFKNNTHSMSMDPSYNYWTLEKGERDGNIYSYRTTANWMAGSEDTGKRSVLEMRYFLKEENGTEVLDFSMNISSVPGEGKLTLRYMFNLVSGSGGTCRMRGRNNNGNGFEIVGDDSSEVGSIDHGMTAMANTINGTEEIEIQPDQNISEEWGALDVSMDLSSGHRSVETGGIISLTEGFLDAVSTAGEEAIDYVMDHIYSFLIGGGLVLIGLLISASIFAWSSRKEDDSSELDLDKSPIYRD